MNILLVAATNAEVKFLPVAFSPNQNAFSFSYKNLNCSVLITGVGMVATTYLLTDFLNKNNFDLIINLGVAGSFSDEIKITDVVNVTEDCFAEIGAQDGENFIPVFDLGIADKNNFPFTDGKLKNDFLLTLSSIDKLKTAKGITVNTVHGNETEIEKIKRRLNPDVETMEGAAFFYVCMNKKNPCLQLRAISNKIEKRNRAAWKIKEALQNLKSVTFELLDELAAKNK